jgi:hypothetical protein
VSGDRGQAAVLLVAALLAVVLGAALLAMVAAGLGRRADLQRAADLGALAGARAMRDAYPRLFAAPLVDGRPNPRHLERGAYLAIGIDAARRTARRDGAEQVQVRFPGADPVAPTRISARVEGRLLAGRVTASAVADAELVPPGGVGRAGASGDEYRGPFAYRQGRPMRPDVAIAFDRMARAAHADGVELLITSAFRSDAEQAALFAARPDPRWVAPPGTSLHRLGTELDLGPPGAYGWLRAHAAAFHFVQRYAWEPWHWGLALNAASRGSVATGPDGRAAREVGDFVPASLAPIFARAAQRWNVSAALLAAQAYRESGLNPFARSSAGAVGIAQLMPATARALGVADATDPAQAIDGQAHLMRDLLRRFGAVALALAAYNAGPGPVARCLCVPVIPETRAYVLAVLGLLGGGDPAAATGAPAVRLVR